ncbi:PTS sugar transporter subunit IIB [Olsenella sp. HMSC062G07]|uniref:PTS sugar transporter subunit IIB n=1 Tax=Olsenella sp. HMSC062G07 TaxID=1739330 RepID=UPI0008A1853D|nr:PTS sugar transporter subunit IIB [Olsenella sp. HMSC062G07]OFK23669.1 hypothetical protein HMPREF2826_04000 [Olsenella sp. HMSC062G07]
MSEIKLVRVDDRLIHAQILLIWLKALNINTILLVDDDTADNVFLSEILKLAMPSHIRLHIRSVQEAVEYDFTSSSELWEDRRTLVLMRDLVTAQRLSELGFMFDEIQISGSLVERGLDRHQLLDNLLKTYHQQLSHLLSQDTSIYCQATPQSPRIYLNRAVNR